MAFLVLSAVNTAEKRRSANLIFLFRLLPCKLKNYGGNKSPGCPGAAALPAAPPAEKTPAPRGCGRDPRARRGLLNLPPESGTRGGLGGGGGGHSSPPVCLRGLQASVPSPGCSGSRARLPCTRARPGAAPPPPRRACLPRRGPGAGRGLIPGAPVCGAGGVRAGLTGSGTEASAVPARGAETLRALPGFAPLPRAPQPLSRWPREGGVGCASHRLLRPLCFAGGFRCRDAPDATWGSPPPRWWCGPGTWFIT